MVKPDPQTPAEPTNTAGQRLREARDARGVSLDELTRTTKIAKATLIALEKGDIEHLPAPVYTRGFIKAYAREVGLDPNVLADDYLRGLGVSASPHPTPAVVATPRPFAEPVGAEDYAKQSLAANYSPRFGRVTTVAAIIGLVVYVVSINRDASDPRGAGMTAGADIEPVRVSADDAVAASPESVSMTFNGPLTVELAPRGPCWIVATVDGERVVARLLQAGERQTLEITDEALLRVGDPGALALSINGRSGRVLGPPGQPVNVKITKDNFKEFFSS